MKLHLNRSQTEWNEVHCVATHTHTRIGNRGPFCTPVREGSHLFPQGRSLGTLHSGDVEHFERHCPGFYTHVTQSVASLLTPEKSLYRILKRTCYISSLVLCAKCTKWTQVGEVMSVFQSTIFTSETAGSILHVLWTHNKSCRWNYCSSYRSYISYFTWSSNRILRLTN